MSKLSDIVKESVLKSAIVKIDEVLITDLNFHDQDIVLIAPKIKLLSLTKRNVEIDMSSHRQVKPRKENMIRGMYGLPGFDGNRGNNLSIYTSEESEKLLRDRLVFLSKGTPGGKGQNGTPPGIDGKEGTDGFLMINGKKISKGREEAELSKEDIKKEMLKHRNQVSMLMIKSGVEKDKDLCDFFNVSF